MTTCTCHSNDRLDKALADNQRLRKALVDFIGVDDVAQLKTMEAIIRTSAAPSTDKAMVINAIHVLIDTMPVIAEG